MINSAGFGRTGASFSYSDVWDELIDMHIKGLLNSIKLVLP